MGVYKRVKKFQKDFPGTLAFRVKKHCEIIEKHLNPGEKVLYAFTGQKNANSIALPNTFVIVLTDRRLLFARKRLLFGYFFYAVTPDLFNDLKANSGVIWGKIIIDTVKEVATISNLSKKSINEIETSITEYMMKEKKKYILNNTEKSKKD